MHRDDEELGSELVTLSSSSPRHFDQVPLEDNDRESRTLDSDDVNLLVPTGGDSGDQDYDPVLSNSLNSSLTGQAPDKHASTRLDRWKYWLNDPANLHTVRIGKCLIFTILLFIVILLVAAYSRHSDDDTPATVYDVRLPQTVFPSLYTISLAASLTAKTFEGDLLVSLSFVAATNQIFLHALDLELDNIYLTVDGKSTHIKPTSHGYTNQYDLYLIQFERTFGAGTVGVLHLEFEGKILPTLAGFYLSTYQTLAGETRTIASTQFESTDARRAFPCFDEPAFKANFSMTITTEKEYGVLSNMPLIDATAGGVLVDATNKRWAFATTVRMSTYLLAWTITDFVSRTTRTTKSNIPVSVWTAQDKIGSVQVALDAAVASIDKYEGYFHVLYPLPKLDMIAIPNFPVGAMENWGLITYRESALLINSSSKTDTEAMTEQNIVATVAHELAHQWFGNYVTMKWWSDLWLNEGFASYVEWKGIAASAKNWDDSAQMVLDSQAAALSLDASQYSHPVVVAVKDPAEIDSLFDALSYDKGCSLLRMLDDVLGDTNFQEGLQTYLTIHAYGNAESDDLWAALQGRVADADVTTFMHRFTQQIGYPVVTLWASDDGMTAEQTRFLSLPYDLQDPDLRDTQAEYKWDLYLKVKAALNPTPVGQWWNHSVSQLTLPYESSQRFLYINSGRYGYFRTNYPETMWIDGFAPELDNFASADLVGFLDDVWTLAAKGPVDTSKLGATYKAAFAMTEFLKTSNEYTPWAAALAQLGRVSRLLDTKKEDTIVFNRYVVGLINNNTYAKPSWTGHTDHLLNLLQASFVSTLVAYGDSVARTEAKRFFDLFVSTGASVPVNIRDAVYRVGIEMDDEAGTAWNFLYTAYTKTLDPSESRRILRALTRSLDTTRLKTIMDWSITDKIKSQDTSRIIIYVALNPVGQTPAWTWVKANYDELFTRFGRASFTLSELIKRVIGTFQTQAELDEAKAFFTGKDLGTATRALQQAYETVQVNIYWLDRRYAELSTQLAIYAPAA